MTAGVDDERPRRQQCFNLVEEQESLPATRNQARRVRGKNAGCAFDLGAQRSDACLTRGKLGASEGSARRLRPQAPHRDPRNDQLMSAFALEDGIVYHTYSTYARGLDGLWGMYQWLDRAPKGRNETSAWWRRHDEYGKG